MGWIGVFFLYCMRGFGYDLDIPMCRMIHGSLHVEIDKGKMWLVMPFH